jgi:KDO2-lipid IV(A) lauroyltransferase
MLKRQLMWATGWLLSRLPLRLLHPLAGPLSRLAILVPWRKHAIIRRNLQLCFPDLSAADISTLHRQHLAELIKLLLEWGVLTHWRAPRINRHLEVHGFAVVKQVLADHGQVIFATSHQGNWEIINLHLSQHLPLTIMYLDPEDRVTDEVLTAARQRFGSGLVRSTGPAVSRLYRALKAGDSIGITADIQPKRGDGVFVPFFGHATLTMVLVNRLASKSQCPVILCNCQRRRDGQGWRLDYQLASAEIADADPAVGMAVFNRWIEQHVRAEPAQYFWLYKRFGIRPDGEPELYPRPENYQRSIKPRGRVRASQR